MLSSPGQEIVEDVEGPLILGLADSTRFLQKISLNIGSHDVTIDIKVDANKFALKKDNEEIRRPILQSLSPGGNKPRDCAHLSGSQGPRNPQRTGTQGSEVPHCFKPGTRTRPSDAQTPLNRGRSDPHCLIWPWALTCYRLREDSQGDQQGLPTPLLAF